MMGRGKVNPAPPAPINTAGMQKRKGREEGGSLFSREKREEKRNENNRGRKGKEKESKRTKVRVESRRRNRDQKERQMQGREKDKRSKPTRGKEDTEIGVSAPRRRSIQQPPWVNLGKEEERKKKEGASAL